jgi:hypothetical protein
VLQLIITIIPSLKIARIDFRHGRGARALEIYSKSPPSATTATYANLGNTNIVNDFIAKVLGPNDHYLKDFIKSRNANFGKPSEDVGKWVWPGDAKSELFRYAEKKNGITEDDIRKGCPFNSSAGLSTSTEHPQWHHIWSPWSG